MQGPRLKIRPVTELELHGKTVIFRPDINSPIDPTTKRIVNTNRIEKTVPTLNLMLERGAKVALIAHQGDTLDYQNLIPLAEHAEILSRLSGHRVSYIDDVCGPAAQAAVKALSPGEAVILGNLRYLAEEISTFETVVKLTAEEMTQTWLVRSLAPLADYYVNDAFAAAHRNAPSMVAFQEILPTAGGIQLMEEYTALKSVMENPRRPCVYVLGGAKISDAFDMMRKVLTDGSADYILTAGVTGIVMHIARGVEDPCLPGIRFRMVPPAQIPPDVQERLLGQIFRGIGPEAGREVREHPPREPIVHGLEYGLPVSRRHGLRFRLHFPFHPIPRQRPGQ